MFSFSKCVYLLLVLLCSAAANLELKEQKEEEEAADGKPEKPQDLKLTPESSSIVFLTWSDSSSDADIDHYFVYVEGKEMEDTTRNKFYIWKDLEACTTYTFGVKAVTPEGSTSDPALGDGVTGVGRPPEPQNPRVEDFTHTTVTLAWNKPDTQCDIENYRVRYYDEEGSSPIETQVKETTVMISNLLPETFYTFSIYATNSEGVGPAALVNQTTAPDPVGPPQDLVAEGISSSAINVSWSAPNSPPTYYVLTAPPAIYGDELVYDLTFLIKGLEPCKKCYITVSSYYRNTDSKFTATTTASSTGGAPPPPQNCSVLVDKDFIAVDWEKPYTPCPLGPYNVRWTVTKLWGSGDEVSDSTNTSGLTHSLYSPLPYHDYTFEIAASIEDIFGSPTTCSGTSLESPAGPPVLTSVESEERGKIRVTWESPNEENGEIIHYGIFVDNATNYAKLVSGDVLKTTIILEVCDEVDISVAACNHALNNEGWGERSEAKNVTVIGDVLPKQLQCLEPKPEVQVCWQPFNESCRVSQYNLKWEGDVLWSDATDSNSTTLDWSDKMICYDIPSTPFTKYKVELSVGTELDETITCSSTTPMAAPGPPTLEKLQTEDRVINVTWIEPLEKNGIISNYQVEWTDWNGKEDSHSTDGNTFSYQIVVQSCGGKLDVTVRAKTVEYGERSPPRSVFLVNSISKLTCKPTNPGVIALSWEVEDSQCPIHMYNVTWTFASLWSEDKGSGWESLDGNGLSVPVESLPPFSIVSLEVHVDNSPAGTRCNATTLDETSDPPAELNQIAKDLQSVTVAWSHPEEVRGELVGWYLTWNNLNGENLGFESLNDTQNMMFQIQELSPSETYVVNVMAVNGAGIGEPNTMNVETASVPPESHLGLILGVSIGGGVLLILLVVGGGIVYKKKHQTKPPRAAPFMPGVIDSDNDKLYKKQHQSSANQRLQGKGETIDFGTNRELYPDNNQVSGSQPKPEVYKKRASQGMNIRMKSFEEYNRHSSQPNLTGASELEMNNIQPSRHEHRNRPSSEEFRRRSSQQVDVGRPSQNGFGRRSSQQVDVGRPSQNGFGRRSSQQIDVSRPSQNEFGRRSSQQIDVGRPSQDGFGRRSSQQMDVSRLNSQEFGRRPSQQTLDVGRLNLQQIGGRSSQQMVVSRPNLKEFGRRPSQQIDVHRLNPMENRRRSSQQIDQGRPRSGEHGRRSSQQTDVVGSNLREYGRRPSQQLELGEPRSGDYARRLSQQAGISGGFPPSRIPQQPIPARSGYDDNRRRPSQPTDIDAPIDGAFNRRPSQQFVTNFEHIKE